MAKNIFDSAESEKIATLAVAYHYSHGIAIKDIPAKMGVEMGDNKVRECIAKAVEFGYLKKSPTFLKGNVSNQDLLEMQHQYFDSDQLKEKIASWSPNPISVHVIKADYLDSFSSMASEIVTDLLKYSQHVGILGGQTLAALVQKYRYQRLHSQGGNTTFNPLSGTSTWVLRKNRHELDASTISSQIENIFNHEVDPDAPVLAGVPAYISNSRHTKSEIRAIKSYIEATPGYKKIFSYDKPSRKYPIIKNIDTIITGIGAFHKDSNNKIVAGEYLMERVAQESPDIESGTKQATKKSRLPNVQALAKLVYGDIGGFLLAKKGLSDRDKKYVDSLNENWMGLRAEHFEMISNRANHSGKKRPGCIAVVFQPSKAEALKRVIELGIPKNVIVSNNLGLKMMEL